MDTDQLIVDILNTLGMPRVMISLIEDEDFNFYYTEVLIHDKDEEDKLYVEPLTVIRKHGDENRDSMLFAVERTEASEGMMDDPVDVFGALATYKGKKYSMIMIQNYDDEMAQQLLNIEIIRAWIKFKQIKSTEEIMEFILNSEEKYGLLSETDIDMFFESRNRDGDGFEAVFGFYDE